MHDSSRRNWITWANAVIHKTTTFFKNIFFQLSANVIFFLLSWPWQIFVLLLATQRHIKKIFYITKADASSFICITFVCWVCIQVELFCHKTPHLWLSCSYSVDNGFLHFFCQMQKKKKIRSKMLIQRNHTINVHISVINSFICLFLFSFCWLLSMHFIAFFFKLVKENRAQNKGFY